MKDMPQNLGAKTALREDEEMSVGSENQDEKK